MVVHRFSGRLKKLERRHAERHPPTSPPTVAAMAGLYRRWLRGMMGRVTAPLIASGGWGSPEHRAYDAAEHALCQLDERGVIDLFRRFAEHLRSGRDDLPEPLTGCPPPAEFRQYAGEVLENMQRGLLW